MIYFSSSRLPEEIWFAMTRPDFRAISLDTGEVTDSLEIFLHEGALVIFPDLLNALDDIAIDLAHFGTLTLYGESMAAGHLRIGKRGVRLAGLQGYALPVGDLADMRNFWLVLDEICSRVRVAPAATPGATGMRIAQALSPERFTSPGSHRMNWSRYSFSAGARHSRPGKYPNAFLYDIHSAYPFAMHATLPFGRSRHSRKDAEFYISKVILDYDSDLPFSPLWVRGEDNQVYHPVTARRLACTLNSIDLATLEKHGRLRITKEVDRFTFQQRPLLAPAQEYLSECQTKYPQYRRQIKILRNAIFGKFVQSPEHERYVLKRIDNVAQARKERVYRQYNGYEFGLFKYIDRQETFSNTAVASAITAMTRAKVYDALDADSLAVRTDSILSLTERPDLDLGKGDGQWDLADKGPATVFGRAGYAINYKPHLDGVQAIERSSLGFIASASSRDRMAFGSTREILRAWNLLIEKPETIKTRDSRIEIYHSPLAKVIKAVVPPDF